MVWPGVSGAKEARRGDTIPVLGKIVCTAPEQVPDRNLRGPVQLRRQSENASISMGNCQIEFLNYDAESGE